MRYKSRKNGFINILVWGTMIIILVSAFIVPSELLMFSIPFCLLAATFISWIWFGTYYEMRDCYLYARSGPFTEKISYDKITSAKLCKNLLSSMALSSERIEIRHGENYISGTTYISPVNRDEFLRELLTRCPNIKK